MTHDLVAPRTVLKFRIKSFIDKIKPKKSTAKLTDAQLINYCKKHNIPIGKKGGAPKGYKWSKIYSKSMRVKDGAKSSKKSKGKSSNDEKLKNLKKARKVKNTKKLKMDEQSKPVPKMDEQEAKSQDDSDSD